MHRGNEWKRTEKSFSFLQHVKTEEKSFIKRTIVWSILYSYRYGASLQGEVRSSFVLWKFVASVKQESFLTTEMLLRATVSSPAKTILCILFFASCSIYVMLSITFRIIIFLNEHEEKKSFWGKYSAHLMHVTSKRSAKRGRDVLVMNVKGHIKY